MTWSPCLVREADRGGRPVLRLGHGQLDRYLEFVAARARPNTVLATGYDLKVFFAAVPKDPAEVTTADVLGFITAQRGDRKVVRLVDGESGLSARTIHRRLSSISGFFGFLVACGEVTANPVPRGLANRKRTRMGWGTPLGADPAHVAEDLGTGRGRRVDGGVSALAGPGNGPSHGAGRVAPHRSPRVAVGRSQLR